MAQRSRHFRWPGLGRTRRAIVALAVVAGLALVAAPGCTTTSTPSTGGTTSGGEKTPIKLGAVVSLTGAYAALGGPEKNTFDMEVAAINAAGGVNGHKIDLITEDDATDPKKAEAAAAKLIDQDKVLAILGSSGTGATMGMRADVDRAGIPQVAMAAGTVVTSPLDKLVFATPWSNGLVVPVELAYLQKQGIKKVALLTDDGAYGKDGLAVLVAQAPKFGMTVAANETFKPTDTDMTPQLTKIKGSGAQVLILWNAGAAATTAVKNVYQLKMMIPIMASHGNANTPFLTGTGAAGEGVMLAAGKILAPEEYGAGTPAFKQATDFIDRYTKQFGGPPTTFAGHGWDALHITVAAMKTLPEGFTSAQLRDAIEKTSGFVGIGGAFTFSPTDHNGMTQKDLVMYKIQNGKWVTIK